MDNFAMDNFIEAKKIEAKKYERGYTCGVFDLFHVGHLNLLERCKALCDYLIVAICDDDYVRFVKQKKPVYSQEERQRIVGALKCVDEAVIVTPAEIDDKLVVLKRFGFDVLFSGDDWKGSDRYNKTEQDFALYNAKIEYLPYTQGVSTTDIVNRIREGGGVTSFFIFVCVLCAVNSRKGRAA